MSLYRLWTGLVLLLGIATGVAHAAVDLVGVPPLRGRIVDLASTLGPEQLQRLETRLRAFEARKGSQIAVLIVPSIRPEAIEQYAIRVAEQWKIGRKQVDDGAILVIAKDDRALRIEVGYGLEGVLNDATSKRLIDDVIVPRFKNVDFYGGIDAGVTAMVGIIDGEALPPPSTAPPDGDAEPMERLLPIVFVAALVLGGALRALLGRAAGAALTGGILGVGAWLVAGVASAALVAALIGFFLTLLGGRMGMGGWYGGHGRHHEHRGGLGGGFRGGGGGFGGGGGGASGRW